jgi:CheY-like chemotaxis protein
MQGGSESKSARGQRRLLIGGDDPDIVELLDTVLALEGYATQAVVGLAHLVSAARQQQADLLVLDVDWQDLTDQTDYPVLDALRADPQTAHVPVVALSTRPERADVARTSYTVRASLVAPFELADLLAAVRQALDEPPLVAELGPAAPGGDVPTGVALAARLLAEHSRAALFRWVLRLRHEEPWRSRSDLHLAQLLDSAPAIVEAVVVTLHTGEGQRAFEAHPQLQERARAHANAAPSVPTRGGCRC